MKHLTLTLLMLSFVLGLQAQQLIPLGRTADRVDLVEDQAESIQVHLNYANIQANTVENRQGSFAELILDGGFADGAVGQPKLPVTQRFIEIPFGADPQVKVLSSTVQELDLADFGIQKLMPMQAPVSKNDVPEGMPFVMDEAAYQQDSYWGYDLAEVQVKLSYRQTYRGPSQVQSRQKQDFGLQ